MADSRPSVAAGVDTGALRPGSAPKAKWARHPTPPTSHPGHPGTPSKTSVYGTHSVGADPLGPVQVAFADLAYEFLHGAGARHHPEWIDPLREARICRHGLDIGGDPLAAGGPRFLFFTSYLFGGGPHLRSFAR